MNAIAGYVLIGAVILMAPVIVVYLITLGGLFSYMKNEHPDHYREMGEPSLFLNNSIANSISVVRFLLEADYRNFSDPRLNAIGNRSRGLFILASSLFGIALLAFVSMSITF